MKITTVTCDDCGREINCSIERCWTVDEVGSDGRGVVDICYSCAAGIREWLAECGDD